MLNDHIIFLLELILVVLDKLSYEKVLINYYLSQKFKLIGNVSSIIVHSP
jgi:hypothetical protein